jgi:hypothetical protein
MEHSPEPQTSAEPYAPSAATKEPTPKEKFDLAREMIRHEDGLVNSRVTWLQVFQGLLFTAFIAGVGLFKEADLLKTLPQLKIALSVALVTLAILGIASSFAAYKATRSAIEQIEIVEKWWLNSGHQEQFPRVAGNHGIPVGTAGRKLLGADMLLVFIGVWLIFLALFAYVAAAR